MSVAQRIQKKLEQALPIDHLEVIDQSDLHVGHGGARPEGETHFRVEIVSSAFAGRSRIDCQRQVNEILHDELEGPVHALSLKTSAPR